MRKGRPAQSRVFLGECGRVLERGEETGALTGDEEDEEDEGLVGESGGVLTETEDAKTVELTPPWGRLKEDLSKASKILAVSVGIEGSTMSLSKLLTQSWTCVCASAIEVNLAPQFEHLPNDLGETVIPDLGEIP